MAKKIRFSLSRCLALQRSSKPITDLHGGTKPRIVIDAQLVSCAGIDK